MTVYQELQLSSTGSKQLIHKTEDKKEKRRHILIYNVKVYLVVAFCFAVVTVYSNLFGSANSVVGVTVLLSLLVLRQADFGIKTSHGVGIIFLIFGILAAGPRLSNMAADPVPAFFINVVCILGIMLLTCHNVLMSNQSTFVLGYLLLQGYDVTGHDFYLRVAGLAVGAAVCAAVFYIDHKDRSYKRGFADLFREFDLRSARTSWYLRLTFGISTAMLIVSLLNIPRVMWVGIASMSVLLPFTKDMEYKAKRRAPFNILGCGIFLLLYWILPKSMYPFVGLLGGIGVGYSAGYEWQTVFNAFGALAIAANVFGLKAAIILRIVTNVFASLYAVIFDKIFRKTSAWLGEMADSQNVMEDGV